MTRHISNPVTRFTIGALAVLVLSSTAAEALDLRAWDQRIDQASKRFVVLGAFDDEAVLDKETQLVWQRTPANVSFTTREQAAFLSGHEESCFIAATGGRYGWRLPSLQELSGLLVNGVLPVGHPFLNVHAEVSDKYWSATAQLTDPTMTLGLTFSGAGGDPVRHLPAGSSARVWCVRGPAGNSATY